MKTLLVVVSVIFSVGVVAFSAQATPQLWDAGVGGNGHYYDYIANSLTWDGKNINNI